MTEPLNARVNQYALPRRGLVAGKYVTVHLFFSRGGLAYALVEYFTGQLEEVPAYTVTMLLLEDSQNVR